MSKTNPHIYLERFLELHPKRIDLTLGRMHGLLEKLDNPQQKIPPAIHVAGTNAKGSTIALTQAMLEAAGYRVHRYISPHLVEFNERIMLAGKTIEDKELCDILSYVEQVNGGNPITYFEITTAACFVAFSRIFADIALIEVGLGGRMDATNILPTRILSIITPVSLDHQEFLGGSYAKIASEKAGIITPNIPVIVGKQKPSALRVIEKKAKACRSDIYVQDRDFGITYTHDNRGINASDIEFYSLMGGMDKFVLPKPALQGVHQFDNSAVASMAGLYLAQNGFPKLNQATIGQGIKAAKWPARLQCLNNGKIAKTLDMDWDIVLDGGHNRAAGEAIKNYLRDYKKQTLARTKPTKFVVLYAMLSNKDAKGFLKCLAPTTDFLMTVDIEGHESIQSADCIAKANALKIDAVSASNIEEAVGQLNVWSKQQNVTSFKDGQTPLFHLLICGSLYFAGQILAYDCIRSIEAT